MSRITLLLFVYLSTCLAFVPTTRPPLAKSYPLFNAEGDDAPLKSKLTLEEKMKSWEASEEEIKAASLGGVVPKGSVGERSDAFDVGLYVLFPIMIVGLGLFAFFPILVQNIDVTSVGPPPTS